MDKLNDPFDDMFAHLNKQERNDLFAIYIAKSRNHRMEAWMNWQLAEANLQRLEDEKKKWDS